MANVCAGQYYTFYSSSFGVPAAGANFSKYDVSAIASGAAISDGFNSLAYLPVTAMAAPACAGGHSKRGLNFSA